MEDRSKQKPKTPGSAAQARTPSEPTPPLEDTEALQGPKPEAGAAAPEPGALESVTPAEALKQEASAPTPPQDTPKAPPQDGPPQPPRPPDAEKTAEEARGRTPRAEALAAAKAAAEK